MRNAVLQLRGFGVSLGDRVILEDVNFDVPPHGTTVLVGPAGCGKSTLLRTLSGLNSAHPSLRTWGSAVFNGTELWSDGAEISGARPALVMQGIRFYLDTVQENLISVLPSRSALDRTGQMQEIESRLNAAGLGVLMGVLDVEAINLPPALQRQLALGRALITDPQLLFVDELEAGLDGLDSSHLRRILVAESERRSILVVTHNQRFAREVGGTTVLLAAGRVLESSSTAEFFAAPRTAAGNDFVRTGGCLAPEVDSSEFDSASAATALGRTARMIPKEEGTPPCAGPRGFYWVRRDQLGGTPRPGIIDRLDRDLAGLSSLGVTVLVTLEEARTVPAEDLAVYGIRSYHFPVTDMAAPDLPPTVALCRAVASWLIKGDVVAFHCRGGLGRTGTLLACQLIWDGETARGAFEQVRAISPRSIQSDAQVAFLRTFEVAARNTRSDAARDNLSTIDVD